MDWVLGSVLSTKSDDVVKLKILVYSESTENFIIHVEQDVYCRYAEFKCQNNKDVVKDEQDVHCT